MTKYFFFELYFRALPKTWPKMTWNPLVHFPQPFHVVTRGLPVAFIPMPFIWLRIGQVSEASQGSTLSTVRSSETSVLDLRTSAFVQLMFRLNSSIMSLVKPGKLVASTHYSRLLPVVTGYPLFSTPHAAQGPSHPLPSLPTIHASAAHHSMTTHASADPEISQQYKASPHGR